MAMLFKWALGVKVSYLAKHTLLVATGLVFALDRRHPGPP